jgi:ParB-like chromosome segregation protein Spo0J
MIRQNDKLTPHPVAAAFPMMVPAEFERLKKHIASNGQLEPVVVCDGLLLDGRNRYKACLELGIEPQVIAYTGTDPLGFVIGKNLHRRHLNESQRALAAAQVADMKRGGARGEAQGCALTHAQVAAKFGISPRQVDKASALLNAVEGGRAIPELLESVRSGERRLHDAEKLSRTSLEEQRKALVPAARRVYGARPSEKRDWDRAFDQIALRLFRSCSSALRLASEADAAGELTPERWKRLVDFSREAVEGLRLTTEQIAVGELASHRWKRLVDSYLEATERRMLNTDQIKGIDRMPFDDV